MYISADVAQSYQSKLQILITNALHYHYYYCMHIYSYMRAVGMFVSKTN